MTCVIAATELIKNTDSTGEAFTALTEIAKVFAWPATIILLALIFRRAVTALIESIREAKLKGAGMELTLRGALQETERLLQKAQRAERAEPESGPTGREEDPKISELLQLAQIAPRAAIVESWLRVEATGAEIVRTLPGDLPRQLKPNVMFGEVLRRSEIIPSEVMKAIMKLRQIRNRVAHESDYRVSEDDAEEYVLLSFAVIEDMRRAQEKAVAAT